MEKLLLLGDEAVAQGGLDAGMSGIYAYPGTPSTEITEYVQRSKLARERGIHSAWSANEKTAMEAALGMSYSGKRAMVCMKHVGLNVAADPFINSAITGANGGLIVVVADDPSMHSSQNEQDSRFYGQFAMVPILEPSNQQEAYEMAYHGFELSEKYSVPVLLRLTTRLAHSRSGVKRLPLKEPNPLQLPVNLRQYVLLPSIAKKRYNHHLQTQKEFLAESENSKYNQYFNTSAKTDLQPVSTGIVACGIAYNYLMENLNSAPHPPILKIGQYPVPKNLISKLVSECEHILVLEEGYPFVESMLKGIIPNGLKISGKLDGTLPRDGELNPNIVAGVLEDRRDGSQTRLYRDIPQVVVTRPPVFCAGCPHIDSFNALEEAMKDYSEGRVFSDIGCYTLAALPPHECINSCVDMGASIPMAKGAADAGLVPAVAVIGDSTFAHSGITGLLDAVYEKSPITVFILDNYVTGMTGGQPTSAAGKLKNICIGVGVEPGHVRIITPLKKHHKENVQIMKEEIAYKGVSVIIPERECIQTVKDTKKK
jgi:indolepyruvate ferredoxin oxidoreductase alpha subunit